MIKNMNQKHYYSTSSEKTKLRSSFVHNHLLNIKSMKTKLILLKN